MEISKPILNIEEQIAYLKSKGVRFEIMNEEDAKEYLSFHNNYFKLTAYRKNYNKHPDGEKKGQYINMDFAYLVDIAVIDMHLRYEIVHMALNIEHFVKLQLLRKVVEFNEDGYQIIQDYIDQLSDTQRERFDGEIARNKGNIYCGDIIDKYEGKYPIWALIEIISFGRLVSLYGFCAERFNDKEMNDNYFRLLTCKEIRNASAHSNCILNDLRAESSTHRTNGSVTTELMRIAGMKPNFRKNRMSNARIQQIVTFLYMHDKLITSEGVRSAVREELGKVLIRMYKNIDYYQDNLQIRNTFDFLKIVIDNWIIKV
ncbi:MAG: Abi family protein [Lachnospiraceae bacterium]|nr:Abi family protein [Lachnospiraceae bacterium]